MMANNQTPLRQTPNDRPLGVWVLTIYALIFDGFAPLFLSLFLLLSGNAPGNEASVLLSTALSLSIIVGAIGAWRGNNTARKSLIVLVAIHYILVAINNYSLINAGLVPQQELTRVWARVYRGFIFPALYFWYFTKSSTKEFYE